MYDICTLNHNGAAQEDIIAADFATYLQIHPNLHTAHRHSFYHIVLFTEGGGTHTIDFEQFDVQTGQIYFMIPGQVHSWSFEGNINGYVINFSEQFFSRFLHNAQYLEQFVFFRGIAKDSVINLPADAAEKAASILQQIVAEHSSNKLLHMDMVRTQLLSLFITASRYSTVQQSTQALQQNHLILFNFRKLVDTYYAEKRLPKDYAAMLYITPNHLNALCNDLLGKPAGEVIRDRILLEAKRLLVNADNSISQIAYKLGFTDNAHFTKFFKKYTATTPETFRKQPAPVA